MGRGWQLEGKPRGWSAVWGPGGTLLWTWGPWVWRGPRVPRGELRVQSAALGLIQSVLASTGASADVAAFAFWSVPLTRITETFSPPPSTYSSVFSHPASASAEM